MCRRRIISPRTQPWLFIECISFFSAPEEIDLPVAGLRPPSHYSRAFQMSIQLVSSLFMFQCIYSTPAPFNHDRLVWTPIDIAVPRNSIISFFNFYQYLHRSSDACVDKAQPQHRLSTSGLICHPIRISIAELRQLCSVANRPHLFLLRNSAITLSSIQSKCLTPRLSLRACSVLHILP